MVLDFLHRYVREQDTPRYDATDQQPFSPVGKPWKDMTDKEKRKEYRLLEKQEIRRWDTEEQKPSSHNYYGNALRTSDNSRNMYHRSDKPDPMVTIHLTPQQINTIHVALSRLRIDAMRASKEAEEWSEMYEAEREVERIKAIQDKINADYIESMTQ